MVRRRDWLFFHSQEFFMTPFGTRFRLVLFISAALALLYLSVMPNPPVPHSGIFSWDKLQHALGYAFLMVLGGWALLPLVASKLRAWRYALIITVVYGALMEGVQFLFTSGRRGDPEDILADALGGLAIYLLIRLLFFRKVQRKEKKS
jgi:VanZ family protein